MAARWIEIEKDRHFRLLPDRRHLIVVRRSADGYSWTVCLGHERNVLEQGNVQAITNSTDSLALALKLAKENALNAYRVIADQAHAAQA